MEKSDRLGLRIDPELKRKVMSKLQREDRGLSIVVRRLLQNWLAERDRTLVDEGVPYGIDEEGIPY